MVEQHAHAVSETIVLEGDMSLSSHTARFLPKTLLTRSKVASKWLNGLSTRSRIVIALGQSHTSARNARQTSGRRLGRAAMRSNGRIP